jgi:Tfp pilus assembly protein PilF
VLYDRSSPPDFVKAEAQYRRLAKLKPHDAELLNDWGYSFYLRNQPEEAEQRLRQALQIDRTNKRASSNLGLVLGQQGRFQEAFEAFRSAGAGEAEAHSNLAFVYLTKGQFDNARRECRVAQRLNPACKPARDMLAKMDSEEKPPPKAPASRPSPTPAARPDREAVRRSVLQQLGREEGPSPVARASPSPPSGPADAEGPPPVYTSPNGTKWFPVPQGTNWHAAKPEQASSPPPASGNGNPGTITFDQNPEAGG